MPRVLNKRKDKIPDDAVYVGKPGTERILRWKRQKRQERNKILFWKELLNIWRLQVVKVLNIKDYGYKVPKGAIYVGRALPRYGLVASKWGNQFKIGKPHFVTGEPMTREDVILEYTRSLVLQVFCGGLNLEELRDKDLVCSCHSWDGLGENPMYCHADILLEMANK